MPSLIKILQEDNRQENADDANFYKQFLYFFELLIPIDGLSAPVGGTKVESNLFPLMLNPSSISLSDPFTVQVTPGLDGGLVAEENGIIMRQLTIRGHTGWKPRPNKSWQASSFETPESASFRARGKQVAEALSGQRHFQFLQDRVFRIYGDLKKDPALAKDTSLVFHNIKDDEHWLCLPQNFTMDRDARRPLFYNYAIEMLVVNDASFETRDFSEDKSFLDQLKDDIRTAKAALDNVTGAVNDVSNMVNELADTISGLIGVLDGIDDLIGSASNFVQSGANLIAQPINRLAGFVSSLDDAIETLLDSPLRAKETVAQSFRNMQDALDQFRVHPRIFGEDDEKRAQEERRRQGLGTGSSTSALTRAADNPPASTNELATFGTANMPGDQSRALAELGVGQNPERFPSANERVLAQGETLPGLAAKYMGDARLWRKIAALNKLQAPFISTQKLPGTLTVGDRILIPSTALPPQRRPLTTVFGVPTDRSAAEQFLGADLRLDPAPASARGFFDFVVDVEQGSTDFKLVVGIDNLKQAIRTRVTTERGTDVLYRRLGYKRLVGLGIVVVDRELAAFRLGEAVAADPRIAAIHGLRLAASTDDVIDVEIDAAVKDLNEQVAVTAELL